MKFLQTGTNILTASVTDGLGCAFTCEQTIEAYLILHLELTADAAAHMDEQISVNLNKDTDLPVIWNVISSYDPATATAYSGTLADNGGTIQITSAGTYEISASVTDATRRVFAAPAVSVVVYPVAGLNFTLPAAAWTDSSTPIDLLTSDLQGQDVTWALTKDGAAFSLTGSMLGDLGNLGGKVRFPEAGTYTLTASAVDVLAGFTTNSLTLNAVDNAEYSMDGKVWQDSPEFKNLDAGTGYTLYQRLKATEDGNYDVSPTASRSSPPSYMVSVKFPHALPELRVNEKIQ